MSDSAPPSASLPAEAAAGLSTRWQVCKRHEQVYTDSAAKVVVAPSSGSFLASWCGGDVALLDLASGAMLGKIEAGSEEVEDQFSSFNIDPSEKQMCTISRKSQMIKLWDISTLPSPNQLHKKSNDPLAANEHENEIRELTSWKCAHQLPVLDIAFSPTGMDIATASADKSIIVYSVKRKGVITHRFAPSATKPGHKSRVVHLFWHPNPKRMELVSCAEDGEMRLWKLSDSSSVLLSNHMSLVTSVAFSKDGNTLISGGRDKVVNVWSVAPGANYGQHLRTLPVYESVEGLTILAVRPSILPKHEKKAATPDIYFTTAGSKGELRTWSLNALECVYTKELPTAAASSDPSSQTQTNANKYIANQVAHLLHIPPHAKKDSPTEEERLVAVTQEQNFYVYSASTFTRQQLLLGFNDEIIDLKSHPDNTHVVMASNSSQIRIMNLNNLQADLISGHTDTVLALDISPCGTYIVSSSKDNTVRFWKLDFANKEQVSTCIAIGEGHTESVGCVTFNRNKHTGKLFAVSGARERIMKLWDCSEFKSYKSGASPARLTAVTSRLAHEKDLNCLECSPNDKLVASGSEDKMIRIWTTEDLAPKAVLKGHRRGVWSIKFSPVDKVLASASGDKTIKLWSMDDFTCLKTLESHTASVKQVMFLNAGMQLLSCGDDAVVKLWTIKTSECIATFEDAHDSKIWAMTMTPDQKRVITGGSDSILNIWEDVSSQDVEEEEMKRETFLLQEQELTNLIRKKQYRSAVAMCLNLEQPRKAYTIVQELLVKENKAPNEPSELPGIVTSLEDDLLTRLIQYIRDWNTHAKTSHVAQTLLTHLFRHLPPTRLQSNRSLLQQTSNLTLYSERHFNRLDKLLTKSYIMDYMLNAMHTVEPDASVKGKTIKQEQSSSNAILQQLLATATPITTTTTISVAIPTPTPTLTSSDSPMDEDDSDADDDDDDDGSGWASNWTAPAPVAATVAVTSKKADAPTTTTKSSANHSTKRKEPTPSNEEEDEQPATTQAKKQKKETANSKTSSKKK